MKNKETLLVEHQQVIKENLLEGEVCVDILTMNMGAVMHERFAEYMDNPRYRWISLNDCGPTMMYIIYEQENQNHAENS